MSSPGRPRTLFRVGSKRSKEVVVRNRLALATMTAAATALVAVTVSGQVPTGVPVNAQTPQQGAATQVRRTADGKPDFNGFYQAPVGAERGPRFSPSKMAPFKPGGEALFYEMRNGDPFHD